MPRAHWSDFPADGSHLQRYAARFNAVEINSSFYQPHRRGTYARWADGVPADFRFAVKLPRAITHQKCLCGAEAELDSFREQIGGLGDKLGYLLVQLPPSLAFDQTVAETFFAALRAHFECDIACEPRHPSWFEDAAGALLSRWRIAQVAADPARVPAAAEPGGWPELIYYRWHGSPRMYYSAYDEHALAVLSERLRASAGECARTWCILDNTALGAAINNARQLQAMLGNAAR